MDTHSPVTLIVQCKASGFLCDVQVAVYKSMGYCVTINLEQHLTWYRLLPPPHSCYQKTPKMNISALSLALLIQHLPHIFRCYNLTSPPV
jgi:hypothetical protein